MKTITMEWLAAHNACYSQLQRFHRTFGNSAALTERNLMKAAADAGLDLSWFAYRYLDSSALQAWREAESPIYEAYCVKLRRARADRDEAIGEGDLLATTLAECVQAWDTYYREISDADRAYGREIAAALWAVIEEEEWK